MSSEQGQQHPISIYLWIWGLLFVLSFFSYMVDYYNFEGYLRWSLILIFMFAKASLIIAFFMHMAWERVALIYAVITPPSLILLFLAIMLFESDYTQFTREVFFSTGS
ncbi:MAG: cytochrome C oxidase subunit IV family protein [Sneathiella sp.]|nr:cytochrome C oxidase subunit IV family protein [Sneathiella sp.]